MKQKRLQSGDSFTMTFVVKENGQIHDIRVGEYIAVGLYDEYCNKCFLTSKDGKVRRIGTGTYVAKFTGNMTQNLVGSVKSEIVIYDQEGNERSHADKIIPLYFDEREINCDI